MTGPAFSRMTTMIRILRDFKLILDFDLYGEHMPEEILTGSKIDLNLSARSTYTPVYTVKLAFLNVLMLSKVYRVSQIKRGESH